MSSLIVELSSAITALSYSDKFRLVQLVLVQLTDIEILEAPKNIQSITKEKSLRGCLKRYAKPELIAQEQATWQTIASEKYEHR